LGINLGEIAAGVDEIIARQQAQALQATVDSILQAVNAELALTRSLVGQVVAVQDSINTLTAQLNIDVTAILTAIADLSATGTGGVLIGAVSTTALGEIGNEVWNWPIPTEGTAAQTCLADAHYYALYQSNAAKPIPVPLASGNEWRMTGNWNSPGQGAFDPSVSFALDYTTLLPSDATTFDWLTRVYPLPWTDLGDGLPALPDPNANTYFWQVNIPQDRFIELKAALFGPSTPVEAAPIWPGLAGVTLGTPVAIAPSFTVTGPMQGVLVALTAFPTLKGQYVYDGLVQALKIGALTFVSDNGDAEYVQALGFVNEVYVPKNMAAASECKVRAVAGVAGTVTPFTIP
jgi:hypothetical protein